MTTRQREIIERINKAKDEKRNLIDKMEKKEYELGRKLRGGAKTYYTSRIKSLDDKINRFRQYFLEEVSA